MHTYTCICAAYSLTLALTQSDLTTTTTTQWASSVWGELAGGDVGSCYRCCICCCCSCCCSERLLNEMLLLATTTAANIQHHKPSWNSPHTQMHRAASCENETDRGEGESVGERLLLNSAEAILHTHSTRAQLNVRRRYFSSYPS